MEADDAGTGWSAVPGGCGKRPFPSRHVAERVRRHFHERLRVYHCGPCSSWHLTNDEKNRKRLRRKPKRSRSRWRA